MGRAYSLDLRERVVAAVASGESCRAVAATFKVSVASVVKWSQRFRATGSAAARPMGGNRPYVLSSERDWLLKRLAEQPDVTLFRREFGGRNERQTHIRYSSLDHVQTRRQVAQRPACTQFDFLLSQPTSRASF